MRRLIPTLITLITLSFQPLYASASNSTIEDVLLKAQQEDKHIFVRFSASWCLPCQLLNDQLANHPEIVKEINEIYLGIELDYDDPNDQKWFVRYGIQCLPTMMVIDDMGQVIDRIDGTESIDGLQSFLKMNSKHPTDKFAKKELSNVQISKNKIYTKHIRQESPKRVLVSADFSIQFGAFRSFSNAQTLSNNLLTNEKISTIILEELSNGNTLYKVRQIIFEEERSGDSFIKSYKNKGIDCMLKKV